MTEKIGDDFQKQTKYQRGKIGGFLDWSKKPKIYKQYPNSQKIQLTIPKQIKTLSLDETIKNRKSIRIYQEKSLSLEQVAYLLWSITGIQRTQRGYDFRNVPSAGALYPIETYLFTKNTKNLQTGLYHYNIKQNTLEELKLGDVSASLAKACLGQSMFTSAPITLIWSAIFERSKWKYKQRAYRYVYLDCGHIGQNLALSATALGLGSCQIGAFYDDEVNKILKLDGENESAIYLSTVGYPKHSL
jgi:SagB-type dehydrogenase family enzyme